MQNPDSTKKLNLHMTKNRRIRKTTIENDWNIQVVQIFCEENDGKFIFKRKVLSRLPKYIEQ